MKKFIIPAVLLIFVCVGVFVALVLLTSRAPYVIPEDRMTFSYIRNLKSIGDFKNAAVEAKDQMVLFATDEEKAEEGVLVRVSEQASLFENFLSIYEKRDCKARVSASGNQGNITYHKGSCDKGGYYVFLIQQDGKTKGILFDTNNLGNVDLDKFVQDYIK